MAMFKIAGTGRTIGAVIFPRAYQRFGPKLAEDRVALFRGVVDRTRDEPALMVDEVYGLGDPEVTGSRKLLLDVRPGDGDDTLDHRLAGLRALIPAHRGPTETWLSIEGDGGRRTTFRLGDDERVALSPDFVRDVESLLGDGTLHLR